MSFTHYSIVPLTVYVVIFEWVYLQKFQKSQAIFKSIILKYLLDSFKMALLKYFKRVDAKKPMKTDIVLPKPDSPL